MKVLYAQPSYPIDQLQQLLDANSFDDVFEQSRLLSYNPECLVRCCSSKTTQTQVAVKSYSLHKLTGAAKEQVDTEIHIHAALVHDHVIPLLLAVEDSRCLHLVVEWADGGDLRSSMGARMGERRLKDFVIRPLLSTLVLLQQKGVVHRDFKPDNVLVRSGKVQLADFGLSVYSGLPTSDSPTLNSLSDSDSPFSGQHSPCSPSKSLHHEGFNGGDEVFSNTSSGAASLNSFSSSMLSNCASGSGASLDANLSPTAGNTGKLLPLPQLSATISEPSFSVLPARQGPSSPELMAHACGTPLYTAPEVLRAVFQNKPVHLAVDHKNDVWGLGILCLEALIGCHPFSQSSPCSTPQGSLLHAVAYHQKFRYPSYISPDAVDFVSQATNPEPDQRPTAQELLSHPWLTSAYSVPASPRITSSGSIGLAGFGRMLPALKMAGEALVGSFKHTLSPHFTPLLSPRNSFGGCQLRSPHRHAPMSCSELAVAARSKTTTCSSAFETVDCWEY